MRDSAAVGCVALAHHPIIPVLTFSTLLSTMNRTDVLPGKQDPITVSCEDPVPVCLKLGLRQGARGAEADASSRLHTAKLRLPRRACLYALFG